MPRPTTILLLSLSLSAGAYAAGTEGGDSAQMRNVILAPFAYHPGAGPGKAGAPAPTSTPGKATVPANQPISGGANHGS